jgi:ribbon-helix-helix CopG family protein
MLSWSCIGDNTVRTQISLEEEEYELAKARAKALGISLAELLRRALREALPAAGEAPWMKFAGFVESGDPSSSQSIDDIVYGHKD